MHNKADKPTNFWQELKHRNVIRVMTVYIAGAFGFLELTDIISGPLNLPGWVLSVVMMAAVIGFPVAFLLSWFLPKSPERTKWKGFQHPDQQDLKEAEDLQNSENLVPDLINLPNEQLKPGSGKGKLQILSAGSLVVITAAAALFLFFSGKSVPFKERDWIVITDFENHTGEEIFDNSLNTAFALSINQSRYINVIPRQRMFETLKRMKIESLKHIDEETGREIALREGVEVCIVPEISRVGSQYILTVRIVEAKTGTIFRSEVLYAKGQNEIIEKLDQLTKKMRRNMGESRYKISGQSKPLSEVTTASLEALKQFSLGMENHLNLEFEKAVVHYRNAIRIDSNFTSAKASLGNLLFERFDREKGREWLDEAILTIDNLTDHEKYSILSFYAINIENDYHKGMEYTKTIKELYPDDPRTYNNLGFYYQQQGQYEKAIEEYKHALGIDPYLMLTYGGLVWAYLDNLGLIDSARIWSEKMIDAGPENPWGYFYLGSTYVSIDNLDRAEVEYLKARDLDPNLLLNLYRLGNVFRLQEKYETAIEVFEDVLDRRPGDADAHYNLGIIYHLLGDNENARSHFLEYKKWTEYLMDVYPDRASSFIVNGLVLTYLGEKVTGWEMGKKALELDPNIHFQMSELLAVQDRKAESLDHLEKAIENGYRDLTWIKLSPNMYHLHKETRYQELIDNYFAEYTLLD